MSYGNCSEPKPSDKYYSEYIGIRSGCVTRLSRRPSITQGNIEPPVLLLYRRGLFVVIVIRRYGKVCPVIITGTRVSGHGRRGYCLRAIIARTHLNTRTSRGLQTSCSRHVFTVSALTGVYFSATLLHPRKQFHGLRSYHRLTSTLSDCYKGSWQQLRGSERRP